MATNQQATGHTDASLYDYDVFLSFRGADIRASFMDVLYHRIDQAGLRVFVDDVELQLGDNLGKILLAIDNSRLCIPIFSKRFAESRWCLMEVSRMVEMHKQILPIFYDVNTEDVNLETSTYKEFMGKHDAKYEQHEVEKWKEALQTISALDGKEVLETGYTAFCETFVKELLIKLEYRRTFDIDPPIGLEYQVQHVMQLLDIHSTVVRYIGIYGMGGIGKTTLAKDIYNKIKDQFDGSSFLEDIRESFRRGGTTCLLEKLLNSLDIPTFGREPEHFPRLMKECFRRKKILIVLDDVHEWEQIADLAGKSTWFGSGSRIIIVSRNSSVTKRGDGKPSEDEVRDFEMEPLGRDNALELFNRHAFKEGTPADGFEELSKKAASLTGGLPLALKIIGSLLYKKRKEIWEETMRKLPESPEPDVTKILRISYDALTDEQKYIYLDIACYFVGSSATYPIYMWKACKFCPNSGLEILRSMSLVKVTDDSIISMHDLLRDLGRDIVREEDIKIPRNRSRLWEDELARKVLRSKKRNPNVEALRIEGDFAIDLTKPQVEIGSLENMRYLDLRRTNLQGNFQDIFPDLIWLSYHCHINSQAPTFAVTSNLVILDLSHSTVDQKWCGWSQLEKAKNLKVLDLSEAEHLTRTPYFPEGMTLERLILDGCNKLLAIDGSIGHLKCLRFLSLERCNSLTAIPDEVGDLDHLVYIVGGQNLYSLAKFENLDPTVSSWIMDLSEEDISNSRQLIDYKICSLPKSFVKLGKLKFLSLANLPIKELPESFGELKSLVVLFLDSTNISYLPDSIKGFEELEMLSLSTCKKLKKLPSTLGALKSLVALDLSASAVVELPPSVGQLARLKKLRLSSCLLLEKLPDSLGTITSLVQLELRYLRVPELPESIGKLKNLEKLSLSATKITKLPESIGGLENLREISLEHCPLKKLPKSFGALKKLEKLHAQHSDLSGGLPSEISGLSSLMYFDLSHSQVSELPSSINQLHCLRYLLLDQCNQLRELPHLPTNLTELSVTSRSLHRVLQLSNVHSLTRLTLQAPPPSSDSVFGIGKLSQLVYLSLIHSYNTTLPDEFGNLNRLKTLNLASSSLRSVPRLPLSLEKMLLLGVQVGLHLPNLPDLKNLSSLEVTHVNGIGSLRFSLPESLKELDISNAPYLHVCPDISHLKNLRNFHMSECQSLTEIPGLGKLKNLEYLAIKRCPSLTKLENLSELERIVCVRIDSCMKLGYPEGIDRSKVIIFGVDFQINEATTYEGHDIFSLLSSPGRDFLIRGDRIQVKFDCLKGKMVCLYFPRLSWELFTFHLHWTCEAINNKSHGELMVVYVPVDEQDEWYFNNIYCKLNWLAIPFSDGDEIHGLNLLFMEHHNEAPRVCIFDKNGQLLTTKGFEIIGSYGPLAFPFTPERVQLLKSMDEFRSWNRLLAVPRDNYVLTLDENKLPISELEGKIVSIYFSSPSDKKSTHGFTHLLHEVHQELKANGESFEIVWAPIQSDALSFPLLLSMLPGDAGSTWVFVCFRLYFYFNVTAIPSLVIIGKDGKILQPNATEAIKEYGAKAFPFTPEKIEKLRKEERERWVLSACREFFITNTGERVDASTLVGKNILLYFASHRSSQYCNFMPKLLEAYNEIQAKGDADFEVIFVSNDKDEASFHEHFSTMPWLAVPFDDERIVGLVSMLEVTESLTLVAIKPTDGIIRKDVRDLIIAYGSDAYPFTNEHISKMVKSWPHKLRHALHAHELALTERQHYQCDACNYLIPVHAWSYYCKECDFDLHPQCALEGGRWEFLEELGTRLESTSYPSTPKTIEKAREERERVKAECERLVVSFSREFLNTNRGDNVDASTSVRNNIVLYFSSQSSDCCAFMPKLVQAYKEIKERGDAFEVITMSLVENKASFHQSCSAMPWLSLPFGDVRIPILYYMLEVTRVPTLVAIGPTDRIIRKDVGDLIVAYGSDAYPFTHEHISNMIKSWPPELQHPLHAQHELTLIERRYYICDLCNYQLPTHAWSYCCFSCNFHLHPKCAFKGGKSESPEEHGTRILSQGECSQSSSRMVFEEGN